MEFPHSRVFEAQGNNYRARHVSDSSSSFLLGSGFSSFFHKLLKKNIVIIIKDNCLFHFNFWLLRRLFSTGRKKPTHDFLSACSNSNVHPADPMPSSQGILLLILYFFVEGNKRDVMKILLIIKHIKLKQKEESIFI